MKVAAPRHLATAIASVIPEALVLGLPERKGVLLPSSATVLKSHLSATRSMLLGPGLQGDTAAERIFRAFLKADADAQAVVDADGLKIFDRDFIISPNWRGRVAITPHAGEMAELTGLKKSEVERDPIPLAREFAKKSGLITILKGATTVIADPSGRIFVNEGGTVGLAVSGSGDVLSGILAGLLSRGAAALTASIWAVHLHSACGKVLSRKFGKLGYLPRELLECIPKLMNRH
jgi:hydroxyethylthiazole kinase-like uncharacterized protein yjeF